MLPLIASALLSSGSWLLNNWQNQKMQLQPISVIWT